MTKVLVAVDDTDESVAAIHVAQQLFGPEAEYVAITVVPDPDDADGSSYAKAEVSPLGAPPVGSGPALGLVRSAATTDDGGRAVSAAQARAAGTAADQIEKADAVDVEAIGRTGDPVRAIVAAADAQSVDVIVVGSHERGWLRRLLKSSVPDDIIRDARCPVLIVK